MDLYNILVGAVALIRLVGVVPLIVDLIKQLKRGDITEKELALAKTNMRGNMLLRQETTDNQCMYNGMVLMILSDVEKLDKSGIVPFSQLFDKYYKGIMLKDITPNEKKTDKSISFLSVGGLHQKRKMSHFSFRLVEWRHRAVLYDQ